MNCPCCGCEFCILLGNLGTRAWVRCRACGTDYSMLATELEEQELLEVETN